MKENSAGRWMPLLMLLLGLIALALRKGLYLFAVDDRGLLVRSHPLGIALAALSAAALILVLLAVRKYVASGTDEYLHRANLPAAFGNVAAGAGILAAVLNGTTAMGGYLDRLWCCLGLAAPVCLLLAGFSRVRGKVPFFGFHVVACLFFVLHIVARYQFWSSDPQLQNYVFALLGTMSLLFFSFYTATLEAGCGNPRVRLGMGLGAIYLCTAELARSSCPALYLGGILWVLTELGTMRKVS